MPAHYDWHVVIEVPNTVVARGGVIDATSRVSIQEKISEVLGADFDEGIKIRVKKEPDATAIEREQR